MRNFFSKIKYIIPLGLIALLWELISLYSDRVHFLFSSPSKVANVLANKIANGELIEHFGITAFEVVIGLILGITLGSAIGFILLYFPKISKISSPYIIALAAIPIFGIAPMMIIWFGIGIKMKIAMVFFSTVFVALSQAYQGGKSISEEDKQFFKLNKASKKQEFWNLIFPKSIDWIIQSLKINIGLGILGAFIGEFIAAEKGLGYIILKASGLYDISYVLAAVICIIILSSILTLGAKIVEKHKLNIIRSIVLSNKYTS